MHMSRHWEDKLCFYQNKSRDMIVIHCISSHQGFLLPGSSPNLCTHIYHCGFSIRVANSGGKCTLVQGTAHYELKQCRDFVLRVLLTCPLVPPCELWIRFTYFTCLCDNTEMETINKIRTEFTLHLKDCLHFNKHLSWRYKHFFMHVKLESCIIHNQNLWSRWL